MQSAVLAMIDSVWPSDCPTVCPTVCHTLVSCQNDSSYDHAVFTGGLPHDSSFQHAWLHRKIPKGTWGARAPN